MYRLLAISCALSGAGCSLVLDFSDRPDAGGANPRCETLEPNDVAAGAPQLAPGTNELALCGDADVDFFTLVVADAEDVVLQTSSAASINIELALLQSGAAVQIADAPGPNESIERTDAMANRLDPGEYTVRVQTVPAGQQGDYDLVLTTMFDAPPDASPDGS